MTISEKLEEVKKRNEGVLAMFATACDPDRESSLEIFRAMGENGADIIEIGIPYSDPLMDGPVLQLSYQRALKNGFKLAAFPSFIEAVAEVSGTPLLVMTCFNPLYKYGVEKFFRDIKNAGADSILLTDLPPEEWGEKLQIARSLGLGTIFLVAPTTTPDRLSKICALSEPFVYCVSKTGVTGVTGGSQIADGIEDYVSTVRKAARTPVMVGFGISTPEQAKLIGGIADGVVVGSALVKIVENSLEDKKQIVESAGGYVRSLKDALVR